MQAQTPAEGIMRTGDWGDSKAYRVACDCGSNEHTHDVWVESNEGCYCYYIHNGQISVVESK
jgi:hypothetical protein